MKALKYIFRIIFALNALVLPIILIGYNFNKGELLISAIWVVVLISNIYCIWEIIQLSNKLHPDNEDPIDYMKKQL